MEKLVMSGGAFRGKRVWLSGHTGFKGGWLATWLIEAGAQITGFSLAPTTPFFGQLGLSRRLRSEIGDIRNYRRVHESILRCRPDFVFHLAAQPIVRESYRRPLETHGVNALGTAHVLEALRELSRPCVAIFITTDKVYQNDDRRRPFREDAPLGGTDPYSASKAAAEILIASYRDSFFRNHPVRIASARSGNVMGGGDYARDRIVPDAFRALSRGRPIPIRNPRSTRPWQHVLETTAGYLVLAEHLLRNRKFEEAYNFGPSSRHERTVDQLVSEILKNWKGRRRYLRQIESPHEAGRLQLHNGKAWSHLGWRPRLSFPRAVRLAVEWYRDSLQSGFNAFMACQRQIREYQKLVNE